MVQTSSQTLENTNPVFNRLACNRECMPTFKFQTWIYHKVDALVPFPDNDLKCLQIYFMGDKSNQLNNRCQICSEVCRSINAFVESLQTHVTGQQKRYSDFQRYTLLQMSYCHTSYILKLECNNSDPKHESANVHAIVHD